MDNNKKICVQCVMDTTDSEIFFDDRGICKYCLEAKPLIEKLTYTQGQIDQGLSRLAREVKKRKKGKYDCLIGLSGGVDSSYLAYLAHKMGLVPLVVHFDNGWNSKVSIENIKSIVNKCKFDFETYIINWPEFRDLQRSFLKAGVLDIEMLTDHAIYASMVSLARKYKIKSILSGSNYRTEHGLPKTWSWPKQDWKNIKAIHSLFGERKLKTFPRMGITRYALIRALGLGVRFYKPLDLVNYSKKEALKTLKEEFNWHYYGGKHYESIFTKFYQAYILPKKFNIDKRKAHFSALIRNHEISREEAQQEMAKPLYEENDLRNEYDYVIKKLGFSKDEFDNIIASPPVHHRHYKSDIGYANFLAGLWKKYFNKEVTTL